MLALILISINVGSGEPPENYRTDSARFLMYAITDLMTQDHRSCDELLVAVEHAVANADWPLARSEFAHFHRRMLHHFGVEEEVLFPAFEQSTGIYRGPTQVMRAEHAQLRQLLAATESALAGEDADDYSGHAETLLIMMQQHNVKEENILYPMCDQHLADQFDTLLPSLQHAIAAHEDPPT